MKNKKVTFRRVRHREEHGFSLLEILITVAILGLLALLAAPFAGKIIRRSQTLAGYSSMRQALASARLQAVKRGVNVVVLFSVTPENKIQVHTFQDRANTEAALTAAQETAAANFQQDTFGPTDPTNEPTLGETLLPSTVVVWKQGETKYDTGPGIAFDEYTPPGSLVSDPSLTDRVAFLPTGGIAPPEDTTTSGLPNSAGGRGIYVADFAGKNFFRVTVDSDVSGRLRVEKYQADAPVGYRASAWTWH